MTPRYAARTCSTPRSTSVRDELRQVACSNNAATPSRSPASSRSAYAWISDRIASASSTPGNVDRPPAVPHPGSRASATVAARMAFRAVIFDLGGVVFPSPFDVFAAYERDHDLP